MKQKPLQMRSLITWTTIFLLCFLIGAGGHLLGVHRSGSWQAMTDSIASDTPSLGSAGAPTWDDCYLPSKIPTSDDSVNVTIREQVWRYDTLRGTNLTPGAPVEIDCPGGFVIHDTVDKDGNFAYPHPAKKTISVLSHFLNPDSSITFYPAGRDKGRLPIRLPYAGGRDFRVLTPKQLDSVNAIWIKEFNKYLDTVHLHFGPAGVKL